MIRKVLLVFLIPAAVSLADGSGFNHLFETKMVVSLQFPYEKGYESYLTGTETEFDNYNFPKNIIPGSIHYKIAGDASSPGSTRIIVTDVRDKDTTVYQNTFLGINDKGMYWWFDDKKTGLKDNHKTFAISLPLYQGKKWKTHLNDQRVEAACITIDTLIETPAGKFNAFGIEMKYCLGEKKDYTQYLLVREFYNQQLGKICYYNLNYIMMKYDKQVFRIKEQEYKYSARSHSQSVAEVLQKIQE